MSNEASRELQATVAEGLLSALPAPLALETARKLLKDDSLDVNQARRGLERIVEAERTCASCGAHLAKEESSCPNCGAVLEADTKADYPATQQTGGKRRKKADPKRLIEATVVNNALVGGSVTGTPTPWGGANPAALADAPAVAVMGTPPPNLRRAAGWERCGNCVFFHKVCNLYGRGRPPAELVHSGGWPVDEDDVCDSHDTLSPQARRLREARTRLAEAEGGTAIVAARARLARATQLADGNGHGGPALEPLGPPRYVARLAGHLREAKGKSVGQALAVAVNVARRVAEGGRRPGEDVNPKADAEASAAVALWEARAADGELGEALPLMEAEHKPIQPSWNFVRHLHEEIAKRDGPSWWAGMAELDEEDRLERIPSALGEAWNPLLHPRTPKRRKGGGQFMDVLDALERTAAGRELATKVRGGDKVSFHEVFKAIPKGRATPGAEKGPHVTGGLRIDPKALDQLVASARTVGTKKAVDDYIAKMDVKWGADWETIRPHLVRVVTQARRGEARAAVTGESRRVRPTDAINRAQARELPGRETPGDDKLRAQLVSALIAMDKRASTKQGWNPNALSLMLGSVQDNFDPAVAAGASPEDAFMETFTPTRGTHGVAKKLGLALDVDRGQWVKNEPVDTSHEPFVASMEGGRMETMPVGADPLSRISDRPGGRRTPGGRGEAVAQAAEFGGAYMAEDYGPDGFRRAADFLLKQGHSEHEAYSILMSKHMRWAEDSEGQGAGKTTNAAAFKRYYEKAKVDWRAEARQLAIETPESLEGRA